MKKVFVMMLLSAIAIVSHAGIRCAPSPMGGQCCWDTTTQGPFQPIGC